MDACPPRLPACVMSYWPPKSARSSGEPQSHRVEFSNDPLDSILAPERFAFEHESGHAENLVDVGFDEALVEVSARIRVCVAHEFGRFAANFQKNRAD